MCVTLVLGCYNPFCVVLQKQVGPWTALVLCKTDSKVWLRLIYNFISATELNRVRSRFPDSWKEEFLCHSLVGSFSKERKTFRCSLLFASGKPMIESSINKNNYNRTVDSGKVCGVNKLSSVNGQNWNKSESMKQSLNHVLTTTAWERHGKLRWIHTRWVRCLHRSALCLPLCHCETLWDPIMRSVTSISHECVAL